MATSGTVGNTAIDTAKLIDHAIRRCGLSPATQTAESIAICKENLYLLLLALANRGLNLWCLEKNLIGLEAQRATYVMPAGTIDVMDVIDSHPTQATGTDTTTATAFATELDEATRIIRIGVEFDTITASSSILLQTSPDGSAWTTQQTVTKSDWETGQWYWFDLDPMPTALHWRVSSAIAITVNEFYLASAVRDQRVTQWNRNDYANQANRYQLGATITNYYLEKKLTPQIVLWPVPSDDHEHLTIWIHRQAQDVGTLTQQIEVPQRWMESIIWQLAARLVFEIPGVSAERATLVLQTSERYLIEGEAGETDGAPMKLAPNISGYTR